MRDTDRTEKWKEDKSENKIEQKEIRNRTETRGKKNRKGI